MEKTELTNAQNQNRVRQRISQASIDPDKYEYIPAKEQNDHVKADQYQQVAIYARVSTDKRNEGEHMKQVWQIDPEFRLLSVPLSLEEENRLENSLLREGCREPIVVWHGCILDGHKRYEICSYEEMDYKTVEMNFVSREDAIIWICKKRVKESSADKTIYKYLVGKWYNAEKTRIHAKRKEERRKSLDLAIKKKGEEGQLVSIPVDRISKVIAVQISMSYNSVESYGMLAKFLDEIAEKDEAFFTALVENKIVVSFEKMRKFAQMDETKLIDIRRKLLREEDVKMRQRKPRQQSTDGLSGKTQQKQTTPLEVGIKEMPMFDPDMEFRGLALTIPTWMNAIARTRAKTDIDLVSEPTKAQLAAVSYTHLTLPTTLTV